MHATLPYYLGFNLVAGIGPTRLQRLIAICGSVAAAWAADDGQLRAAGCDTRARNALRAVRSSVDLSAELARLAAAGVTPLAVDDPHYPPLLREVPTAPPLIYLHGTLLPGDLQRSIAIVGTRRPSSYGREVTERLVADLAAAGLTIVSGLALGIDTVAHRAALARGGRTLAVLAGGVDRPYPQSNLQLARRISSQGALISDYPLGTPAAPLNFPPRNRIISGLSRAVLVVEAGEQSGAMITVNFALDQGRDVLAVPGSILNPASSGPNHLLRQGALAVRSAADVLEALDLAPLPPHNEPAEVSAGSPEAAVVALLRGAALSIDEISRRSGLPAARIAAVLALLEVRGSVRRCGPHTFIA
jgi:DNA processing protein